MALRTIVKKGDPILNKKCRVVTEYNERLHTLIDDMKKRWLMPTVPVWRRRRWA